MSNNLPVRRQEVEIVGKAAPHALGLGPRNFGELESFAKLVHESGMFKDIKSAAAAVVKMAAGAELGLTPIASLRSLHVFEGKVEMGAHLILGLCKQAGYSVKVLQTDQYAAMLEWYDPQGNLCGPPVGFTYKEAENAGLTRKFNWKAYAADMLWARAISRGARRYCPEVTHGVYVEGEISQAPPIDQPPARSHQQQPTPQPTIEPAHHDAVEAEIVESTASAAPPADGGEHPGQAWKDANRALRGAIAVAGVTDDERKAVLRRFWNADSSTAVNAKHLMRFADVIGAGPTDKDRHFETQAKAQIEKAGGKDKLEWEQLIQLSDLAQTPWQTIMLERLVSGGEG